MSASGRILCVGDIHGCAAELAVLLESLALEPSDQLVFLGDYIDRGDQSAQTIELLLEVRAAFPHTVFLRGNHEDMLLDFLGFGGSRGEIFVRAGGAQTLASYGIDGRVSGGLAERARGAIPDAHLEFFSGALVHSHHIGPWAFAHAGVRPGTPLGAQSPADLFWIRDRFLAGPHGLAETVVYGHTPHRDVAFSSDRRVGLDTGCVYGGRLSALDLRDGVVHQVTRGSAGAVVREAARELSGTLDEAGSEPVRQAREALLRRAALRDSSAT